MGSKKRQPSNRRKFSDENVKTIRELKSLGWRAKRICKAMHEFDVRPQDVYQINKYYKELLTDN